MARLSAHDERALHAAAADLHATTPPLATFLERLRALVGADRAVAYAARSAAHGYALDFAAWSGFEQSSHALTRKVRHGLATASRPWALFDPLRPARRQRNVVVATPPPSELPTATGRALLRRLGFEGAEVDRITRRMRALEAGMLQTIELGGLHGCRVLVCDGPWLLGFVGAFRQRPFGRHERALVSRLVPSLRERLAAERLELGRGRRELPLPLVVEALPTAAFLLRTSGVVELANARAFALLRDEPALLDEIEHVARGGTSRRFFAHRSTERGLPRYVLVVELATRDDAASSLRNAAIAWRLSARQVEVLARIVRGESNKEIAAALGCATRTIEFHVTQLLARSATTSRTELVAYVLGLRALSQRTSARTTATAAAMTPTPVPASSAPSTTG